MPWKRKTLRLTLDVILLVLVVAGGALFFLTQTRGGSEWAVEEVLRRLQDAINGEIVVERVTSSRVLEGVTLQGVRIHGPSGDLFFSADSVRLEYAPRTFLSGDVILSTMTVWRGTVVIRKKPGEEEFNVDRVLKEGDDEPGPRRTILLRNITLHDSRVLVYYPIPEGEQPGAREVVVPTEDGEGLLRRLAFHRIEAGLPEVIVSSPDSPGPEVEVASLSLVGRIYEDPFRVVGFEGHVGWADSQLSVDFSDLRLPGTVARGQVLVDFRPEEGPAVEVGLRASELALSDLQWLEPRLPRGQGRGEVELHIGPEGRRWRFADLDLTVEESRIAGEGVILEGRRGLVFEDVSLDLSPLALHRLEPFLAERLPVQGTLRGRASFSGTLDRLQARGRLTLDTPDRAPSTADFAGILHLDRPVGATDLEATLDPFDFGLAAEFFPALEIRGPGRVELQATGRLGEGIRFTADVVHRPADLPRSHVVATGTVRRSGEEVVLDLESDVQPLSFTALRTYYPSLPVSGEVSGRIATRGPLSNLTITTDLDTEAGELDVVARLNARNPRAFYQVEGEVADFRLSQIVPGLPEPTVVNGYIFLEGRGTDAATLRLTGRLRGHDSRVGNLFVDTVYTAVRVADGILSLDTLDAVAGGVRVDAQGTLAVAEGEPSGEIQVAFESDSLAPLRPLFFGDEEIITRDDLTDIDRRQLEMEGTDPDTLPTEAEVAFGGRVRGEVTLRGSIRDFSAEGEATFEEVRYGTNYLRDAEVAFSAEHLPGLEGDFSARVVADSLEIRNRAFSRADVDLVYREPAGERPGGEFQLFLERHEDEDYRARATFEVDTAGGVVHLDELALRFDTLRWELVAPTAVAWTDQGLTVDDLRLERTGVEEGMRLRAEGTLPFDGPADFTLEAREVSLERLARLAQVDSAGRYGGVVDLDVRITGRADSPVMTGTVAARDLRYDDFMLDRVEGEFDYEDRQVALDLDAWRDELRVLVARGTVPVDLSFQEVATRIPEEPIDLEVVADSFPAALGLSFFEALEDVEGTVAGEFHIGGTVEDASPSGTLELQNAGVTFPALGVRHRDIQGTLTLSPDGTVDVDARGRSGGGTAVVDGTLTLAPLTDPTFNLDITLREFRAVARSDVEGTVSGDMVLQGRYGRPFLEGTLTVDEGVLHVEEFQRSAQVVDLSDPAFFDVVDTTRIAAPPRLGAAQNPFLQNLRMAVDLRVERGTWLRSADMNVEIGGELLVAYDRGRGEDQRRGDLVLVGELEATRGSYSLYGRRFVVQEGTVEFVGTPGINPDLSIEATNRIRQIDGDPLTITATVTGTLEDPRVVLSSPESAVAQSDLVSYLIFGRPTYELASGEAAVVEGAAGRLVGTAAGAGLTLGFGTLTSRLGTLLGQEWEWLDYLAITQTQEFSLAGLGLGSTLAGTQVELGKYLSEDLFAVIVARPLVEMGQTSGSMFGGVRLEWTVTDTYTVEAFWEDRFLRRRTFGFGQLGVQTSKVLGFLLYREWGY